MKKTILLLGLLMSFSFSYSNNTETKLFEDVMLLDEGEVIKGEIVKFGSNNFKVELIDGSIKKIKNNEVVLVAVSQKMTSGEKYRLGILDGKRYAKNKGGNFIAGFFLGLIGTAVVYASSDQMPSYDAIHGPNKTISNDADYLQGYSKGAKSKSGGSALLGTLTLVGLALLSTVGV